MIKYYPYIRHTLSIRFDADRVFVVYYNCYSKIKAHLMNNTPKNYFEELLYLIDDVASDLPRPNPALRT